MKLQHFIQYKSWANVNIYPKSHNGVIVQEIIAEASATSYGKVADSEIADLQAEIDILKKCRLCPYIGSPSNKRAYFQVSYHGFYVENDSLKVVLCVFDFDTYSL
jgi:AMMECR1 domain-containing protein